VASARQLQSHSRGRVVVSSLLDGDFLLLKTSLEGRRAAPHSPLISQPLLEFVLCGIGLFAVGTP
jgi:hypothetical protein